MNIEYYQSLSLKDLKVEYEHYIRQSDYAEKTIRTIMNDTFYIWKHEDKGSFWSVVLHDDFEDYANQILTEILCRDSKSKSNNSMKGYVSHLKKFRSFLELEEYNVKKKPNKVLPKRQVKKLLPDPTKELIDLYIEKWNELENYCAQEKALDKLFFTLCPKNNDIYEVLLKVSTLNDFYSTNIFSTYPVAKHICCLNIDDRLEKSDPTLVEDIMQIELYDKKRKFYSFASKYCSHHKPLDYPIFDRYVEKVLKQYRNQDSFFSFKNDDLEIYLKFKEIILHFRKYYKLENYSIKEIDKFLWQIGKEYFKK